MGRPVRFRASSSAEGGIHLDPDVRAYYDRGREAERLHGGFPSGQLERERTKELILRYLPTGGLRILDIGGGAGVYARWLMDLDHTARLVEPVPLHVKQATEAGIDAELGDARSLTQQDGSADVVLLLGPLYHLPDASDRHLALREAHRVLPPGGLISDSTINMCYGQPTRQRPTPSLPRSWVGRDGAGRAAVHRPCLISLRPRPPAQDPFGVAAGQR